MHAVGDRCHEFCPRGSAHAPHLVKVKLLTSKLQHQDTIAARAKVSTMPPRDLTGFDPQKLAAASGRPQYDPWARNEAWRYSGPFTRRARFWNPFPGLGIATVAFAGYLVYEQFFMPKSHAHGDEHH